MNGDRFVFAKRVTIPQRDGDPFLFNALKSREAHIQKIFANRIEEALKEIAKELRRLEGSGKDYVLIDDWRTGRHFTCTPSSAISDGELKRMLDSDMERHGVSAYEIRRYRNLEELHFVNTFVCVDVLT